MLRETYDNLWEILDEESENEEIEELLTEPYELQRNLNVQARPYETLQQEQDGELQLDL